MNHLVFCLILAVVVGRFVFFYLLDCFWVSSGLLCFHYVSYVLSRVVKVRREV